MQCYPLLKSIVPTPQFIVVLSVSPKKTQPTLVGIHLFIIFKILRHACLPIGRLMDISISVNVRDSDIRQNDSLFSYFKRKTTVILRSESDVRIPFCVLIMSFLIHHNKRYGILLIVGV